MCMPVLLCPTHSFAALENKQLVGSLKSRQTYIPFIRYFLYNYAYVPKIGSYVWLYLNYLNNLCTN